MSKLNLNTLRQQLAAYNKINGTRYVIMSESDIRFEQHIGAAISDIEICAALADDAVGFGTADFFRLNESLVEIRKKYAEFFMEESKIDKEMVYAKSVFERNLQARLPECMRKDWATLFDLSRHTPGLRMAYADNVPAECEAYNSEYSKWQADNRVRQFKRKQTLADKKAKEVK